MTTKAKVLVATVAALLATVAAVLNDVGSICERLGIAACIDDIERSATVDALKLEQRVTAAEFSSSNSAGDGLEVEPQLLGIRVMAQITVRGFEGESVTIHSTIERSSDGRRLPDLSTIPISVDIPAPTYSRTVEIWQQAPTRRGSYTVKIEAIDASAIRLAFARSDPIEWPLPVEPIDVATPRRVVKDTFQRRFTSSARMKPAPLEGRGYWARVDFRLIGVPECEAGGADFPCYLPLRTAPDFRDSVGQPITKQWPVDRKDWVWVTCQADGNGVEDQGLLTNSQRSQSNRWSLIALGADRSGVTSYAWGNDLWLSPKGPLGKDGGPKFPCETFDTSVPLTPEGGDE